MLKKFYAIVALVIMLSLVVVGPAFAFQTDISTGSGPAVAFEPLSDNRASVTITFADEITEYLSIFVNGHEYTCTQTSSTTVYCIGYFSKDWTSISVSGFNVSNDATNLVLNTTVTVIQEDTSDKISNPDEDTETDEEDTFCEEGYSWDGEACVADEPSYCDLNPDAPMCGSSEPTFCELNPEDPTCSGSEPTYCELNPETPECDGSEPTYCELNPEAPECGSAEPTFCELNPEDPTCGGTEPTFCELNPEDPTCGGTEPTFCEMFPEDPECSY